MKVSFRECCRGKNLSRKIFPPPLFAPNFKVGFNYKYKLLAEVSGVARRMVEIIEKKFELKKQGKKMQKKFSRIVGKNDLCP